MLDNKLSRRTVLAQLGLGALHAFGGRHTMASALVQCRAAAIPATFLEPGNEYRGWLPERWRDYFIEYQRLGFRKVFIQWTYINGFGFSGKYSYVPPGDRYLEALMRGAEQTGTEIVVGLANDTRTDEDQFKTPIHLLRYLNSIFTQSDKIVKELSPHLLKSSSFGGWYLSAEVSDLSLEDPGRAKIWKDYLVRSYEELRKDSGDIGIYTSSYVMGRFMPDAFAAFWDDIWSKIPVTMILQDGYGIRYLEEGQLIKYMEPLNEAAQRRSARWGLQIELFRQTHGFPVDGQPLETVPASLERLEKQIALSKAFDDLEISSYAASHDMFERGTIRRTKLAEDYAKLFCAADNITNLPYSK